MDEGRTLRGHAIRRPESGPRLWGIFVENAPASRGRTLVEAFEASPDPCYCIPWAKAGTCRSEFSAALRRALIDEPRARRQD
jgi:hypothetical protein